MLIRDVEFWSTVRYADKVWQLIDKEHKTDHITIRRLNDNGKYVYKKLPWLTPVEPVK